MEGYVGDNAPVKEETVKDDAFGKTEVAKDDALTFAALRFERDENLSERSYWYFVSFSVNVGERVLAPVGVHDKLQCGVVERVLCARKENAPYDVRFLKSVAAKLGARKLRLDGVVCRELGGLLYDEKHYTRLGRVVVGNAVGGSEYGIEKVLDCNDLIGALRGLSRARDCVLLRGAHMHEVAAVALLAAGVSVQNICADARLSGADVIGLMEEIDAFGGGMSWLRSSGLTAEECALLREKLH